MLRIVKEMRTILILGIGIAVSLAAATAAMADTVTIASSLSGLVYYDGEYCGKIGATLNGTADSINGGMACVDISKNSYTGSTIGVTISTLQPSDMTNARFGADAAAILKYEEAAWLLGQIPSHSDQTGEIQFAIWRLFDPGFAFQANADRNEAIEDAWLAAALAFNLNNYDFSSVRIYTPTAAYATNQEFMSGAAIMLTNTGNTAPAPIPASILLLASGLLALVGLRLKRKAVPVKRGLRR
jgi:hypothetical protein